MVTEKKLAIGDILSLVQEYTIEKYLDKKPTFRTMEQFCQKRGFIYTEKIHEGISDLSENIFALAELNS